MIITPTVGRVVWYRPSKTDSDLRSDPSQPLAAIVSHVHSDRCVNLAVFDAGGCAHSRTSVTLLQENDELDDRDQAFAMWMPYQRGQAAKSDELGDALKERVEALELGLQELVNALRRPQSPAEDGGSAPAA